MADSLRIYSYAELLEDKKMLLVEQSRILDEGDEGPKPDLAVVDHQIRMVEYMMSAIAPPQYATTNNQKDLLWR